MLNWLAPATVCLLLFIAAVRQDASLTMTSSRHEPLFAMILSNGNAVAYLPGGSSQIERNILPATFESTNLSRSGSIFNFMPSGRTND